MFKRSDFANVQGAKEKLSQLKGQFKFPKNGDISEINDLLEKVIFSFNMYGKIPKYVLTRALYPTQDGGNELQYARFVVRPSVNYDLFVVDMKKTFQIPAGKDFFDRFIDEMIAWFDEYNYYRQLQTNIEALNQVFDEIVTENNIPFRVQFSLGSGLLDASDTHAVVGLDEEVVKDLSSLPLFDEMEIRRDAYKARITETLLLCQKPYSIVKVKSQVTKDLGIYSRKTLSKMIRDFVNRRIEFVRTGVGYVETEDYFAVIEKVAVSEQEAASLQGNDVLVIDNPNPTEKEKEAGKIKIAVTYKISPFAKEDGTPVDVELQKLVS